MNLKIQINGKNFFPLRAVPFVTSEQIDKKTLAQMLSDPEAYCDSDSDLVLQAHQLKADKTLINISYLSFRSLALNPTEDLPMGCLIACDDIKQMYNQLMDKLGSQNPPKLDPPYSAYDESPLLTESQQSHVLGGLEGVTTKSTRTNDLTLQLPKIEALIDRIATHLETGGYKLDRQAMPGIKKQWIDLLIPLERGIRRADSTLIEHFSKLGLKWVQGQKKDSFKEIKNLMKSFR